MVAAESNAKRTNMCELRRSFEENRRTNFFIFFFFAESSGGYGYTSKAFIFSLRNVRGVSPFKSMVTQPQYAIYKSSGYGPTFGYNYNIYIANNANAGASSYINFGRYSSGSYSAFPGSVRSQSTFLTGTKNFLINDWEVFYLA